MQSDKRGRAETFCIGGSCQGPDQEQDPGAVQPCWAEPMMQPKLCEFGRNDFSAPLNVRSPQKLSNSFSAVLKVGSPSGQAEIRRRPGGWLDVEYGYAIVSGSRNSCATELSLFGQKGRQGLDSNVARDTEQYLLQYLICPYPLIPQDNNAGQVCPRGIGIL